MNHIIISTSSFYLKIVEILENLLLSILVLFVRIWMATIFWYSGLTKIENWPSTLALFKEEYKTPIIPYELAAYFSTAFELICPILLVLGLGTRVGALPMLVMTIIIQSTYLHLVEHIYWMMLLTLLIFYGPGRFSLDYFIKKKFKR